MTAAVNAVVGEIAKQSLMGDDIKGFGEVQNTNVHLQAFVVVYGYQVMESKEELGLAAEAGTKTVLEWREDGHLI